MKDKRIVLWCADCANQRALSCKVAEQFNLAGIVLERRNRAAKYTLRGLFKKFLEKLFFYKIDAAWYNMLKFYKNLYPDFPKTEILKVEDINCEDAYNFTRALAPDIIMVSGTRIIGEKLLSIKPAVGIINLHTGLSPYVKGSPNCTNWCLANNEFHLIGNTVMWLGKGIDSGNIIATDFVNFTGEEDLNRIHIKVMEEAHSLYLRALEALLQYKLSCPSVKQSDISEGKLYLTKMWRWKQKTQLLKNIRKDRFYAVINSEEFIRKRKMTKTVKLPIDKHSYSEIYPPSRRKPRV